MQDKNTQHTSPSSTTDLGWERMAALLDAEMPTQAAEAPHRRQKRGLIWLWLLVGFVITAGAAATIYQYKHMAPKQPEKPAKEGFNPAIAHAQQAGKAAIPAAGEKTAAATTTVRAISPSTVQSVPSLQQKQVVVGMIASGPESVTPFIQQADVSTTMPDAQSTLAQHVVYSVPASDRWTDASPLLKASVPTSILRAQPDLGFESALKTKRNNRKKVRFGVELATGIAVGTGSVENFSAGAIAMWKPRAMVSARSGLLVGRNTGDLYMPASTRQSLAGDPNGFTVDNSTPLQALESRAFSGQAYRFQAVTLQLPAVLSYYLSPRLNVEGGITAGLLLNLQNVTEASGEFDQLTNVGTSPTANFSQAQLSDAVSNSVARWELLASAGLRCQITPKFSIGLHYQHGLNDLLPDSNLQAMQRNVRLSGAMLF